MSRSLTSWSRGARFLRAALVLALVAVVGCAGRRVPESNVAWPTPPDKPRLKYVESIVGPATFETGAWRRFKRAILGSEVGMDVYNPSGVALSPDETRLYVTCPAVARVLEFDFAKKRVRDVANSGGERPKHPYGVATDAQGRLYVSDQKEAVVWVYSAKDELLLQIGRRVLVRPTGVAIDRRRQVLYVLDGGTRAAPRSVVEVFALDGRHLRTMGSKGAEPGQLHYPGFAAVGPDGSLYVADTMNSRVQVFDPEGTLLTTFGSLGDAPGQFGKPKGIALDAQGNVHVVDGQLGYVQVFDPRYRLLMLYGGLAPLPEYMQLPNGIAINSKNEIFIADYIANRVNKYVLFDTSPSEEPQKAPASAASEPAPTDVSPAQPPGSPSATAP